MRVSGSQLYSRMCWIDGRWAGSFALLCDDAFLPRSRLSESGRKNLTM